APGAASAHPRGRPDGVPAQGASWGSTAPSRSRVRPHGLTLGLSCAAPELFRKSAELPVWRAAVMALGRERRVTYNRRTMKVFNTLSQQKEELVPLVPGRIGIYVC